MTGLCKTLAVDIETRSDCDLSEVGVYKYVDAPSFNVLLFAYAFDDRPVEVVDLAQGEVLPPEVAAALTDPAILKTAFNAAFERVCLDRYLGQQTGPWACTMVKASAIGLGGSLALVGQRVGLPVEEEKLAAGKKLIKKFCHASKALRPEDAPEDWAAFKAYCRQDVVAERAIRAKLARFELPEAEARLWALDQKINDRGIRIDLDFTKAANALAAEITKRQQDRFEALTGFREATKTQSVKRWVEEETGIPVPALNKEVLPELERTFAEHPRVLEAIALRFQMSMTSIKKYATMEATVCADGRSRGNIQFFGASTGRFAGKLIQVHNLPQNHLSDLATARAAVQTGDLFFLQMLYDNPADILRQCIRTAIIPAEGKKFVVADFSAIEARVLAWLAGEDWRMAVFRGDGKIYEASAAKMFGVPVASIHKGDPLRQKGKVAELALGYAGSSGALKAMGALDMGLSEDELPGLVDQWREANQAITAFWYRVQWACERAITERRMVEINTWLRVDYCQRMLRIHLPSGRAIYYPKACLREHRRFAGRTELCFEASKGRAVYQEGTYYGKLTENIVQAVARDCLAHLLLALDARGFFTVFHVHDEVIVEVPEDDERALPEIISMMGEAPAWAPGLPLRGDGYECTFYMKD